MPPREAAEAIRQIATGLEAAHQAGLVHRDVKPDNILIYESTGRAKLTDFGLARSHEATAVTRCDVVAGTLNYMSPEQADSPLTADTRSDIYSLGITLYECLTGTPPFTGQPLQVLEQHRQTEPIRPSRMNPLVPRDLENVCLMAIAQSPARRYQSAQLLAIDIERFLAGRPVVARETSYFQQLHMFLPTQPRTGVSLLGAVSFTIRWHHRHQYDVVPQRYEL